MSAFHCRAPVMGTPASVVSEPPLWQVSTAQPRDRGRGRKQASANIFQDAELVQIQGLFQRSGDQLAEERAQIIWECAGDHRVAEALRRLRRKRPPRQNHCSRLRYSAWDWRAACSTALAVWPGASDLASLFLFLVLWCWCSCESHMTL